MSLWLQMGCVIAVKTTIRDSAIDEKKTVARVTGLSNPIIKKSWLLLTKSTEQRQNSDCALGSTKSSFILLREKNIAKAETLEVSIISVFILAKM